MTRRRGLGAAELPRVLALPIFAGVRSLDLSETPWGDACVPILIAAAERLPARLVLRDAGLGEAARRLLAERLPCFSEDGRETPPPAG